MADDAEGRGGLRGDALHARALRLVEADDDARGRLAEEQRLGRNSAAVQLNRRAQALTPERREAALCERDTDSAVGAVVRGVQETFLGGEQYGLLHGALARKV